MTPIVVLLQDSCLGVGRRRWIASAFAVRPFRDGAARLTRRVGQSWACRRRGSALPLRARRTTDFCAGAANTSPISASRHARGRLRAQPGGARAHARHARSRGRTRTRSSPPRDLAGVKPIRAATALQRLQAFVRADPGHGQGPLRGRDRRHVRRRLARARPRTSPPRSRRLRGVAGGRSTCWRRAAPTRRWCTRNGATTSSSNSSRTARSSAWPQTAAIKVTREIRTARHCMFPIEGRGVVAYRDARLRLSHRHQREPDAACACSAASPSASASRTARSA